MKKKVEFILNRLSIKEITSRTRAHVIITNLVDFPFIFTKPNIFPSFARLQLAFFATQILMHQPGKYYVCEVVPSEKFLSIGGNNTQCGELVHKIKENGGSGDVCLLFFVFIYSMPPYLYHQNSRPSTLYFNLGHDDCMRIKHIIQKQIHF